MNNPCVQNSRCAVWKIRAGIWSFLAIFLMTIQGFAAATGSQKHPLMAIEIAGVSLTTPTDKIVGILQTQGYTQVNSSLFTKSEPAPNGRSTVYRIEIDDTATSRELGYFRSLTGGRNKSPSTRDAAIPETEVAMVRQLYDAVCNVPEDLQTERKCTPVEPASVVINHGMMLTIDTNYSVLLKASDSSTSLMIKEIGMER